MTIIPKNTIEQARKVKEGVKSMIENSPQLATVGIARIIMAIPKEVGSSTIRRDYSKELSEEIYNLFKTSEEQNFEDGMESEFSKKLILLVKTYANKAIDIIADLILYERVNAEVASEALRWLGNIDHAPSYHFRLFLLEQSLSCSKARIRDGAILGLASLNDPHALSYLKLAIEQEKGTELCKDMEQVLAQLESIS